MVDADGCPLFNHLEDHVLAMLFSHLPGQHVARLACVCARWREVVQGEGSDESIWKLLWDRDFAPYLLDSPASTPLTGFEEARLKYVRMAAVDQLCNPTWRQVHPTNGSRTIMDRQGSSAATKHAFSWARCLEKP